MEELIGLIVVIELLRLAGLIFIIAYVLSKLKDINIKIDLDKVQSSGGYYVPTAWTDSIRDYYNKKIHPGFGTKRKKRKPKRKIRHGRKKSRKR